MLNNHEANLTDEEAAAEVARVAQTYPVVRLLSADQIKSEPNCLLAGDRCPCLRQSSLEALADSGEVSEQLLNDGVEYRAHLRPLKVEGEPHVLLMVRPIDEQEAAEEDLVYTDVLTSVRNRRYYEEKLRSARMNAGVAISEGMLKYWYRTGNYDVTVFEQEYLEMINHWEMVYGKETETSIYL